MLIEVAREDIDRGLPCDSQQCAIALALERQTGMAWAVGPDEMMPLDISGTWISVSERVRRWILAFDRGSTVFPITLHLPDINSPAGAALAPAPAVDLAESSAAPLALCEAG